MRYFTYAFMAVVLLPALGWGVDLTQFGTEEERKQWEEELFVEALDMPKDEKEAVKLLKARMEKVKANPASFNEEDHIYFLAFANTKNKTPVRDTVYLARLFLVKLYESAAKKGQEGYAYKAERMLELFNEAYVYMGIRQSIAYLAVFTGASELADRAKKDFGTDEVIAEATKVQSGVTSIKKFSCSSLIELKDEEKDLFEKALPDFNTKEVKEKIKNQYGIEYDYQDIVRQCFN